MTRKKVLVIGGTGHFGRLLIEDLTRHNDCDVVAPPRREVDLRNPAAIERALAGIDVAVCAAGPFQDLPVTLAEACLKCGVHYIDLADDRQFVRKVRSLIPHENYGPAICAGWATAPALSGALAGIAAKGMTQVDAIYVHMAPGNRIARGPATIASLLHSVGQPLQVYRDGRPQTVRGWTEARPFAFPAPIGKRAGYIVDVPDHELFPDLFRARTVEFRTASEMRLLNGSVSILGWAVRRRIVQSWVPFTEALQRLAALFSFAGHDWGAVGVEVTGVEDDRPVTRRATILTRSRGQSIAVMPAAVMTSLLLSGEPFHGLVSPADWITRERLSEECEKRNFQLIVEV